MMAARRSPPQGFQGLEVINSPQNTSSTAVSGQWPSPPPPPVQYYDAPEVVPFQEKIYVGSSPDTKPLPGAPSAFSPSEFSSSTPGLKGVSVGGGDLEVIGPQKTWWKRKRVWLTGLIVGILILGLVVGLAVGLLMARNGSTSNNT
jgi:hypothetical protein